MATITIPEFEYIELLRRNQVLDTPSRMSSTVTISVIEHDYLQKSALEYRTLKNALIRGGLSQETLDTLLAGNDHAPAPPSSNRYEETYIRPRPAPVTMGAPPPKRQSSASDTTIGDGPVFPRTLPQFRNRVESFEQFGETDSSVDLPDRDDDLPSTSFQSGPVREQGPIDEQRTILISNLPDGTTHKDVVGIIRGGRVLDIILRSDHNTAIVSFVEGAQDYLAYRKREDIYLHTKRLEFRWSPFMQSHVSEHMSNKIAHGATRNIVVRGAVERKITADQIRDHLDHIHNLVVIDVKMNNGDAYISTNSINNAGFARTCMMSRLAYKGLRIEHFPDECAVPLPKPTVRAQAPTSFPRAKTVATANPYTVLDADGIEGTDSDESDDESYVKNGSKTNSSDAVLV